MTGVERRRWYHRVSELVYYAGELWLMAFVGPGGPHGAMRRLFRVPVTLYRWGLGPVIGRNVLLITTRGRRTGRPHTNATRFEHEAATDSYFLLSGWKGRTDWYRNALRDPQVVVWVGRRRFRCQAVPLTAEGSERVLRMYLARNPFAVRTIAKETGLVHDGTEDSLRRIAEHYPAVALRPTPDELASSRGRR